MKGFHDISLISPRWMRAPLAAAIQGFEEPRFAS
jgi:hypothetical protein